MFAVKLKLKNMGLYDILLEHSDNIRIIRAKIEELKTENYYLKRSNEEYEKTVQELNKELKWFKDAEKMIRLVWE